MVFDPQKPVKDLNLEQTIEDLLEAFHALSTLERMWMNSVPNRLANGSPSAAPSLTTSVGSVSEAREWASSFYSKESEMETALSSAVTATLSAEQATLEGARSTDPRMDGIRLYTRKGGGAFTDWRLAQETSNPVAGSWTLNDVSPYTAYIGNRWPLYFEHCIHVVCGKGYRLRRVKMSASRTFDADTTNYWILGIQVRKPLSSLARLSYTQTTEKVDIKAGQDYFIPFFKAVNNPVPTTDLDWELFENERVYLTARGVNSPAALPYLKAMVDVTREVS